MLPEMTALAVQQAPEINVVPMNFRRDHVPVPGKPGEFKEVDKVDLVKKGSNGEATPWTIKALQKEQFLWPAIKPYYQRWLEGQDDPVEGTPLDVLPFVPKGMIDHLRLLMIRSAEDLAGVTDADLNRIGMGARRLREKARAYVENQRGDGKLAELNADLKAENEQMRGEIAELRAQVNALAADRPKRGRPRKQDDAQDAD